jgi:multidrug resistance efflux pump
MNILRNKKVVIPSAIVVVVLVLVVAMGGEEEAIYDTIVAERMDLVQEINATGRVEAVDRINLAFERSGRVEAVYAEVGDVVRADSEIVQLESSELYAERAQAIAAVESAKATLLQYEAALANQDAKLAELKLGARPEEVAFYLSRVESAQAAVIAAHEGMIAAMQDGNTRAEDAMRSQSDPLFNNPSSPSPDLKLTTTDFALESDLNTSKASLEAVLDGWQAELLSLSSESDLSQSIENFRANLQAVKIFLEKLAVALNGALTTGTITQTTIDAWIIDISAARTSVNVAITSHTNAKEKLSAAETALSVAMNELTLRESGGTPEQIDAQEALVSQAEANIASQRAQVRLRQSVIQSVEARIAKNILRAPFAGTVTKQNAKKGALVVAGQDIATIISEGQYEIEALIVEADIVGLEVGDRATLTLLRT